MTLPKPRKIEAERYEGGLSQFKKIDNLIKLSANESALGPSPRAIEAFEREKNKIFKYPESESSSLRDIISEKFNINSERIICGAGSDQIFDLTCQLFIEPGDEVIVTEYGFIMHRIYASLYRAKVLLAKEKNFKASVDEILKKVTDKTKIVFIANPNNPTGTYLSKSEMLNLRKKLRSNILLVVDDAYFEFLDKDDFTSGLDLFKDEANVLITRTFSKIYGLAGLRLGWGYSSKEIIDVLFTTIKNSVMFMKGGYDLKRTIETLEDYMRSSGMESDHRKEGDVHHFIIQHKMGMQWSIFTELLLRRVFAEFEKEHDLTFQTTESTVIASIPLGSDFDEHDY